MVMDRTKIRMKSKTGMKSTIKTRSRIRMNIEMRDKRLRGKWRRGKWRRGDRLTGRSTLCRTTDSFRKSCRPSKGRRKGKRKGRSTCSCTKSTKCPKENSSTTSKSITGTKFSSTSRRSPSRRTTKTFPFRGCFRAALFAGSHRVSTRLRP